MSRPRIVIVGAGFAGYRAARTLSRLTRNKADITLLNPTDYFLYLPLLPQVAAGILEPRRVTVSLSGTLPHVRLVLGEADAIDLDGHTVHYSGPEGDGGTLTYDRLILAAGSVNKLLPIPGVAEHAHGFRGLPEALYLRDHVTRQVELAAAADDPENCSSRCTFVVVGAGYTGTEVAAQGKLFTDSQVRKHPLRAGMRPRWLLLDIADRVLPELDERLSRTADRVLRQRGVDVRMGTSVKEATHRGVLLTDGEFIDTRTVVWCVGVRPDPLAESLDLPMERGRLLVDPYLQVPGRPELFAAGDGAAVPDLEKPGQFTPMTAQHAWRHGKAVAQNVAASLGIGERRPYRHRDKGFAVDLGGVKAAANPFGVPLSGVAAGAVTRGYHLAAMPGNRIRVAADWFLDAVLPRQAVQLGLVREWSVPLDTASPELARVPGGPEKGVEKRGEKPGERPRETDAGKGAETGAVKGGGKRSEAGQGAAEPTEAEEPDRSRSGGEPVKSQPGGEPAKGQPGGEPAKSQPGGELAKNQPGVEPTTSQLGGESAENQPGGEPAKRQLGGEPRRSQPGGEAARSQPGGEPAKNQPGGEPAKNQPGGEPATSQLGGEPRRSQPGGEAARSQPGGEPAKNQPGGEPAKSQPGGEPAKGPGPGPATAAGPVEHTGAAGGSGASGAGRRSAAAKGFASPGPAEHPDATEAQESKRFGAPISVRRPDVAKGRGSSGTGGGSSGTGGGSSGTGGGSSGTGGRSSDPRRRSSGTRGGAARSGGRTGTPQGTRRAPEPSDPVQDPDSVTHPEPPGPVTRDDLRAAHEPPPDAPAVHKPHPEAPGPRSHNPSEGAP